MTPPTLRVALPRDAEAVSAIYAPVVRDTAISFELEPPDSGEMRHRIEITLDRFPWLVAEKEGRVCGYAYAARHRERAAYAWSVDVSVYVADDSRRRGVGRALYAALLSVLARQGFHRAYAGITLPNASSVALHESLGFAFLGRYREVGWKLGAWHDVGWWERPLSTSDGSAGRPLPFADWRHGADGVRALAALLGERLRRDA